MLRNVETLNASTGGLEILSKRRINSNDRSLHSTLSYSYSLSSFQLCSSMDNYHRYSKTDPMLRVHQPALGIVYHLRWGQRGMKGVCVDINHSGQVRLMTPKGHVLFKTWTDFKDLQHTRRNQYRIQEKNVLERDLEQPKLNLVKLYRQRNPPHIQSSFNF